MRRRHQAERSARVRRIARQVVVIVAHERGLPDYVGSMVALLTKGLGVVCPSCDFLNVVAAVRCMACGFATDAVAPAPRAEASKPISSPSSVVLTGPGPVSLATPLPAPAPPISTETPIDPLMAPPGLRRAPASSDSGQRPRPPASSASQVATPPATPSVKFGLTVTAGPARGQRFKLSSSGGQIGRSTGVILFPDDPFVSPLHATLIVRDGKLLVRDERSTSGVYVSITNTETIPAGATFSTGLRLFRFVGAIDAPPPWNRSDVLVYGSTVPNGQVHYSVEEVLLGERGGRCLLSPGPVLTVGQGRCDFSYPNDEGLAPRHCEISPLPDGAMIRDLSGGLGTFVRIADERPVKAGDRLRIGQQTLLVESL
jgi:pSer/pThr/pTyr-binding forkhead associated (FHA) protein